MSCETKQIVAYRCPSCAGKISRLLIEDEPGGVHTYQWRCVRCFLSFGPEWVERVWSAGDPVPKLIGLEPWYDSAMAHELAPFQLAVVNE